MFWQYCQYTKSPGEIIHTPNTPNPIWCTVSNVSRVVRGSTPISISIHFHCSFKTWQRRWYLLNQPVDNSKRYWTFHLCNKKGPSGATWHHITYKNLLGNIVYNTNDSKLKHASACWVLLSIYVRSQCIQCILYLIYCIEDMNAN